MAQSQAVGNARTASGKHILSSTAAWSTDRWAAVVVLGALGALIMLRMGFRGVSLMGASASL